jgi:S1-C subfamily serine protease
VDASVGLVQALLPVTAHVTARVAAAHPSARILGTERMGSAVVIEPGNLLLTVNYVVMGARRVRVTMTDGRRLEARVVAQDFESGLALLRVAATGLPVARLGSSDDVRLGASVFVIAATGPTGRRVAGGIVTDLGEFEAYWEYLLDRGIVSSAANPGFGGGPLFDLRGTVVGVASLNLEGIGRDSLAIPIEYFTRYRSELVRFGRVTSRRRRAWIGVFPHTLDERLVVAGLVPDGPGERAGLQDGDVILRVDDQEVASRRDLYAALWRREPGERVRLDVMREDRAQTVEVLAQDRSDFYALERRASGESPAG